MLWTWAGINLLSGIVFGTPWDDLCYVDMGVRATLLHGGGMVLLALFGLLLVEVVL